MLSAPISKNRNDQRLMQLDDADGQSIAIAEPTTADVEHISEPCDIKPNDAKPKDDKRAKPKRQPPYVVILHNDDKNTCEFVIATLQKVFRYGKTHAYMLMMKAHFTGRCIVWSGMREHAELKADQIRSCGPDPVMSSHGACALGVSIEPLPD